MTATWGGINQTGGVDRGSIRLDGCGPPVSMCVFMRGGRERRRVRKRDIRVRYSRAPNAPEDRRRGIVLVLSRTHARPRPGRYATRELFHPSTNCRRCCATYRNRGARRGHNTHVNGARTPSVGPPENGPLYTQARARTFVHYAAYYVNRG